MERRRISRKSKKGIKKYKKISETKGANFRTAISRDKRLEVIGVVLCLLAVLSAFGAFGVNAGFVGLYLSSALTYLFGIGALLFTAILLLTGLYFITEHKIFKLNARFFGFALMFTMFLALYHYVRIPVNSEIISDNISVGGGLLGGGLLFILRKFFGETFCGIVIFAGLVISVILSTNWSLGKGLLNIREKLSVGFGAGIFALTSLKDKIQAKREKKEENDADFKEADLYDQEWDDEYISSHAPKVEIENKSIVEVEEEIEEPIEEEPPKPKLHSFWQDMERKEVIEKAIEEAKLKEYAEVLDEDKQPVEDPEVNYLREEAIESAKIAPQVVPASKRTESGMGEGGFEVRADAFRSREEVYPNGENEEFDLSNPEFGEATSIRENKNDNADIIPLSEEIKPITEEKENFNAIPAANTFVHINQLNETPEREEAKPIIPIEKKPYELPEVTHILSKKVKTENLALKVEIEENAKTLSKTLSDFKVNANIINACHGPAVTRYELEPAPGVKVSKITGLSEDIALALAATSVRIEPIPGKSAIGIEVPNKELEGVQLREVLERPYFKEAESKLTVGLGIDIGGQAIFADLAKMPHLLIAGSTGSGKSVCVNTLITSILFKAKPDEVKFILIDPKMVELSNYNGIPHLMTPVVIDAKKAASVLNWAVREMEKRYAKFAEKVVRNMESYNSKFPEDKMCSIVIIIDELADLMMVAPHDVEDAICRLAQKARAAGIHLVLATQRPSVDVITGIIKANIPSRIAFAVSSQIDSRTILDSSGAEKLLGRGDMLFYPIGSPKPTRVQGAFVSDEEVELLLDFIKNQGLGTDINEEIETFAEQDVLSDDKSKNKRDDSPKVDELLLDAVEFVISTDQASASNIQRRFRVGYARAGRIIDTMEILGIVGPSSGSKPREILMSLDEAIKAVESTQ